MSAKVKVKEIKAYGVDLLVWVNSESALTNNDFLNTLKGLDGFIGIAPFGIGMDENFNNSQSIAALFDSESNRNKAYNVLSEKIKCAVIMETAHIPATNGFVDNIWRAK